MHACLLDKVTYLYEELCKHFPDSRLTENEALNSSLSGIFGATWFTDDCFILITVAAMKQEVTPKLCACHN